MAGIPDLTEYRMAMTVEPKPATPNTSVRLTFEVFDPWKDHRVEKFTVVHEKLFHAFIVSRDLQFFLHDHPTWEKGSFHYDISFPKPGMYRVLGDFYPEAAAPQLLTETMLLTAMGAVAGVFFAKWSSSLLVHLLSSGRNPVGESAGFPPRESM